MRSIADGFDKGVSTDTTKTPTAKTVGAVASTHLNIGFSWY